MSEIKLLSNTHMWGNRGIHFVFENGVKASIQFGLGAYCDQKEIPEDVNDVFSAISGNVEIACFDKDGKWITQKFNPEIHDDVIGHFSIDEIPAFLEWCKNYKPE